MTVPPPGGWQPPRPPPNQGQPYGQTGNYPQQPPPPGWQQSNWPQPSGPSPTNGNNLKWLLIGVAVLLVIGISVGATLLVTHNSGGGGTTSPTSGASSDFASADDTGPVSVILDDPTCKTFNGINNNLAAVQTNGWGEMRSGLGPASEWTDTQRTQVRAVVESIRTAADQTVSLAKLTPHRVVREIYEQFIAYSRAYADSIPTYKPADDGLASVFVNASATMIGICNSIEFGSTSRALTLEPAVQPSETSPLGDPSDPRRFITASDSTCSDWVARLDRFNTETSADWQDRDSSIPGSQWTPERRQIEEAARPLLESYADDVLQMGSRSGNPTFEDFAATTSIYIRAYLTAGNSYINADGWLNYTAFRVANLVAGACRAVAG